VSLVDDKGRSVKKVGRTGSQPEAALTALLLVPHVHVLAQVAAPSAPASAPAAQRIEITGTAERESATGPVKGYKAARSATATKTDTPLIETPASVQVISAETIADQGAQTLTEVYRNVSGMSVDYHGNNVGAIETPVVRGFALFNTYVNGLPTSGFPQTLSNVERVEVLRGAASVLYGVSQPGGTVNVVTRRPSFGARTSFSAEAGTRGAYALSGDVDTLLNEAGTAAFRVNLGAQDLGSFRDHVHDRRVTVSPSLAVQLSPRTTLLVDALAYRRDYTFDTGLAFSPQGRPIAPISTFLGSKNANDSRMDAGYLGYALEHAVGDGWTLRHTLRRIRVENTLNTFRPSGDTSDALTVSDFYDATVPTSANTQALVESVHRFRTGSVGHTLLAGFDWRRERYEQNGRRAGEPPLVPVNVLDPDNERLPVTDFDSTYSYKARWQGLYLQDQLSLLQDRLKLLGGLRHDRFREVDGFTTGERQSVTTYRLGALYRLTEQLSPYINHSTSFYPNSYSPSADGTAIDPERGRQIEAGLKWGNEDAPLAATLALYRLTKDNVAVADAVNPGAFVNGGRQRSQGVELDVTGRLPTGAQVVFAYGLTDTEVLASDFLPVGARLKNVPRHTLRLWLSQQPLGSQWKAAAGVYHATGRFGNDANTFALDAYTLVDVSAEYRFEAFGRQARLSAGVKNLFDREHYLNASATGSVVPGAPRSAYLRLSGEF
jgi:iron complex outermembrane recepter protein